MAAKRPRLTLVLAAETIQNSALEEELIDFPGVLRFARYCVAPRTAEEAVLEGLKVGTPEFENAA